MFSPNVLRRHIVDPNPVSLRASRIAGHAATRSGLSRLPNYAVWFTTAWRTSSAGSTCTLVGGSRVAPTVRLSHPYRAGRVDHRKLLRITRALRLFETTAASTSISFSRRPPTAAAPAPRFFKGRTVASGKSPPPSTRGPPLTASTKERFVEGAHPKDARLRAVAGALGVPDRSSRPDVGRLRRGSLPVLPAARKDLVRLSSGLARPPNPSLPSGWRARVTPGSFRHESTSPTPRRPHGTLRAADTMLPGHEVTLLEKGFSFTAPPGSDVVAERPTTARWPPRRRGFALAWRRHRPLRCPFGRTGIADPLPPPVCARVRGRARVVTRAQARPRRYEAMNRLKRRVAHGVREGRAPFRHPVEREKGLPGR